MSKVLLKDIDPRIQNQYKAAEQAVRTNPQYAMELSQGLLHRHPEVIEFRRLLRRAQKITQGANTGGLTKLFSGVTSFASHMGASKLAQTNPKEAMESAEKMLAKRVTDAGANRLLAAAAENLGLYDTAAFALEELCLIEPKIVANRVSLAGAFLKDGNPDACLAVVDKALKDFPGNGELQELARRASVAKTMEHGAWGANSTSGGAGGYQSLIKDSEEARRLEQQNRMVNDAASAGEIIASLTAQIAADPENLNLYRDLVKLYVSQNDNENALLTLRKARKTTIGKADASLEKQESDLVLDGLAETIRTLETSLAADPANTGLRDRLDTARKTEAAHRLEVYRSLVERYPNDYNYRFEYGVQLLAGGKLDDAVRELQLAQRSPKHRQSAMLNIGRAFSLGKKYDLAAETLATAKGELPMLNDIKKDVVYELGLAYEKAGREKEAIDEYKSIYMADSGFRDVAKKINDYYEKKH